MSEVCGNNNCNNICGDSPRVCSKCKATPYCSRECQKKAWKLHKKLCASLNKGAAQQLHHDDHDEELISEQMHSMVLSSLSMFPRAAQEMYRLFKSTPKEEDDNYLECRVLKMKKLALTLDQRTKEEFMHALVVLLHPTKTWLIEKPTSPLLILFQTGVNADALSTDKRTHLPDDSSYTCLCQIAQLSSAKSDMYNKNQVILGRQFLEVGGANVNARANAGTSFNFPLYNACASRLPTNPEFIQLLLEHGADPNMQTSVGETPLMNCLNYSVGVGIQLLSFEQYHMPINVNLRRYDGHNVLSLVNGSISQISGGTFKDGQETTPEKMEYLLKQLLEFKTLLEARGAMEYEGGDIQAKGGVDMIQQKDIKSSSLLEYDVSSLFNIDLNRDFDAPSWCSGERGFYIRDELAAQYEAHENKEYLHGNSGRGCGRKPQVGQRVVISAVLENDSCCEFVGKVVQTFAIPTDAHLKRMKTSSNPSDLYQVSCNCTKSDCPLTRTGKRFDILRKHGAVHTQQVLTTVKLTKASAGDPVIAAFFGVSKWYDILLRCDDTKLNMWQVAKIEPNQNPSS
mmetsp:Transcript_27404/g.54989  ORF Transcript_27404/g.54989 Transcript_27404/m.54989 type:complete len:569 (-) Transcript_27404:2307-4013(-)